MANYETLDALLGTTEGMECLRNNSKQDDGVNTVVGVDWFRFNGVVANNLYVSGNHFVGFGVNAEQLRVCRRDGDMWYLYRQEGKLYDYYRFLKIGWEGYTRHNSTSDAYALKFELFLFDNGDMFLNVIQTPTDSGYMGNSDMACNGQTTPLAIAVNTPVMISFYHQDDTGLTWDVRYERINIKIPYVTRYLLRDGAGVSYTLVDGVLTALEPAELTGQYILENGFEDKPNRTLLQGLVNPAVLCWHDDVSAPTITAKVTAIPPDQVVVSEPYDMSHPTIVGIEGVTVDADDTTQFSVSFDGERTWRAWNGEEWVIVDAGGGMTRAVLEAVTMEQWALAQTSTEYKVRAVLTEGSEVRSIVVNYANREASDI